MDSSLLLQKIQTWRECTGMYPGLDEGNGLGNALPWYAQAQHPASGGPASTSLAMA